MIDLIDLIKHRHAARLGLFNDGFMPTESETVA